MSAIETEPVTPASDPGPASHPGAVEPRNPRGTRDLEPAVEHVDVLLETAGAIWLFDSISPFRWLAFTRSIPSFHVRSWRRAIHAERDGTNHE
jgi:hypothetical protein